MNGRVPGRRTPEPPTAYYDAVAATYAEYADSFATEELLGDFLSGISPFDIVLDVGCGTGRDLRSLSAVAQFAVGIDVSAGLLGEAQQHCTAPVSRSDARSLPFRAGTFS